MATQEQVFEALQTIIDPDLGRDIVSLGFVKDLEINNGDVRFVIELTTPACPVRDRFKAQAEEAVKAVPGVETVDVTMTAREPRRPGPQTGEEPQTSPLDKVNSVIAVSSCKGGVGKSTVAAQLARAMAGEGLSVGLLDADVYGPSAPTLFNLHRPQVFVQEEKLLPVSCEGLKLMSLGFLLGEQPAVLRGPIVSNYIMQILAQTDWGALDYLLIDLPPGTGDIQLTIVQRAALDGAVIVTTPQALSLVDVAKGILMFEKVNVPVLGIVENMSWFQCGDCGAMHYPFGRSQSALQQRFGLPTLAELPITNEIGDVGGREDALPQVVKDMAENVHRAIGKRRAEPDHQPEVAAGEGFIHVEWPDGYVADLPNKAVRVACPCAVCVDEHTGERVLDPADVPEDISVESVDLLGNYAVAFQWSDNHSTGIYAWDYLRGLAEAYRS